MDSGEQTVSTLREAVVLSPDNLPLRQHLCDTLMGFARYQEAEREYRAAIARWPEEPALKVGLAAAFDKQGKTSAALVVVEEIIKAARAPGRAFVLHARLLLRSGDPDRAALQYRRGVELDAASADTELAARLRITEPGSEHDDPDAAVVDGRVRAAWADAPAAADYEIERPAISFADVGGMDTLKEEVRMRIIHPLTHASLYKTYGKTIGGGVLMYGPPGCGKTYLARATAGEINAAFMAVGINDVLDMWIGNSEKNLHELFQRARRSTPCVLFFDEVDALAASRADMRASAGRHLINQFLAELDGVQSSNDGVLILAATNAPWHLDAAFRRPGRFDRIMFVPPPDTPARAAILRILCKGKPVSDVDFDYLGRKTDGFSGADLKAAVDAAIDHKLRDAMREGVPRPLGTKDLLKAAGSVRPSTREWFATARNYALYSNQGGTYDDILKYLKM